MSRQIFLKMGRKKSVDLMAIGARIRELRGEALQEEFADFLGMVRDNFQR